MATNGSTLTFRDFGSGAKVAVDDAKGILWLQVPIGDATLKAAKPSSSGKTRLVASSGGFTGVGAVRVNLVVTTGL